MRRRLTHDWIVFLYTLLAGFPAIGTAVVLLWTGDFEINTRITVILVIVVFWLTVAFVVKERVTRPLQTMANLLSALREGDFSVRARGADRSDPLGDALAEINTLSRTLQASRFNALEATALLRTVMAEIDVAIFAFDDTDTLRLSNHAAQTLLALPGERMIGRSAAQLNLADTLDGEATRLLNRNFPGGQGRWGMRRSPFREEGRPHQLVVIADLSRTLREEELRAWQSLVRVLGHELNNSLAPIKSIAGSLGTLFQGTTRAADWEDDMRSGLAIIAARADSLERFMEAYARLARLPLPVPVKADLGALVQRIARLETRLPVQVSDHPPLEITCDPAQIEQVLLNLIKNAVEASLELGPPALGREGVRVVWEKDAGEIVLRIEDDGPGIANASNLFIPFFTTKPHGTGIGLVLCRQIAENHHGSLTLENSPADKGCIATLRLPA